MSSLAIKPQKERPLMPTDYYNQTASLSLNMLSNLSEKITSLRQAMRHVGVDEDADAIYIELDGTERLYFHYFNQMRIARGFKPLEGEKFSMSLSFQHNLDPITVYVDEEIRYESLLFK
jgi:hypothetical protein